MIASFKGDYEMMENLINIGVPINARDNDGNNSLHWLSKFEDKIVRESNYPTNHLKCYNLLVRHGIDLENMNYSGETVYDSFEKNSQCREILNYYYRNNPPSNWFSITTNFLFYLYLFLVGFILLILLRLVVIKYDINIVDNLHLKKMNYTLLPQAVFGIIKDFQLYIEDDEFLFNYDQEYSFLINSTS